MNVTEKSTKKEIIGELRTVEKLLAEAEKKLEKADTKRAEKVVKRNESNERTEKVGSYDISKFSDNRKQISGWLFSVENTLVELENDISDFRQTRDELEKEIDERHKIKTHADTLQSLLLANSLEKEKHNNGLLVQAKEWESKIDQLKGLYEKMTEEKNAEYKNLKEGLEKEYKRKKDDFEYDFKSMVTKQSDEWERRKKDLEQEIIDQQKIIADRHAQFEEMQCRIDGLDDEIAEKIDKAVDETIDRMNEKHEIAIASLKNDYIVEIKTLESKVEVSTAMINEYREIKADLLKKLDEANARAEKIASDAIAGNAKQKFNVNVNGDGNGK